MADRGGVNTVADQGGVNTVADRGGVTTVAEGQGTSVGPVSQRAGPWPAPVWGCLITSTSLFTEMRSTEKTSGFQVPKWL